ncbi:hypothetical protein CPC08DRAFT_710129 [Agrocybe pediades]|nr:hypothetical protein CPC08DRAFT_710129 [Agrocybe pediades]
MEHPALRKQASSKSLKSVLATPTGARPKGSNPATAKGASTTTNATIMKRSTVHAHSPQSKAKTNSPGRGLTVRIDDDVPFSHAHRQSIQSAPVKVVRRLPAAPGSVPPVPQLPPLAFLSAVEAGPSKSTRDGGAGGERAAPATPATAPATFGETQTPRGVRTTTTRATRPLPCPPSASLSGSPVESTPTSTPTTQTPATSPTPTRTPTTRVVRPLPVPKFNQPRRTSVRPAPIAVEPHPQSRSVALSNSLDSYRSSTIDLTPKKPRSQASQKHIDDDEENEEAEKTSSTDIDSLYGPLFTDSSIDLTLTRHSLRFAHPGDSDIDGDELEEDENEDAFEKAILASLQRMASLRLPTHSQHRPRRSVDSSETISTNTTTTTSASSSSLSVNSLDPLGDRGTPHNHNHNATDTNPFLLGCNDRAHTLSLDPDLEDDDQVLDMDMEEGYVDYARVLSSRVLYRRQLAGYDPQFQCKWSVEKKGKRVTQQDIADVLTALRTL